MVVKIFSKIFGVFGRIEKQSQRKMKNLDNEKLNNWKKKKNIFWMHQQQLYKNK